MISPSNMHIEASDRIEPVYFQCSSWLRIVDTRGRHFTIYLDREAVTNLEAALHALAMEADEQLTEALPADAPAGPDEQDAKAGW
jgi:hypothetical protein